MVSKIGLIEKKNSKISKFPFAKFRNWQIDFKAGIEERSLPSKKTRQVWGNTNMLRWDVFSSDYRVASHYCPCKSYPPLKQPVSQLLRHGTFGIGIATIVNRGIEGENLCFKGRIRWLYKIRASVRINRKIFHQGVCQFVVKKWFDQNHAGSRGLHPQPV